MASKCNIMDREDYEEEKKILEEKMESLEKRMENVQNVIWEGKQLNEAQRQALLEKIKMIFDGIEEKCRTMHLFLTDGRINELKTELWNLKEYVGSMKNLGHKNQSAISADESCKPVERSGLQRQLLNATPTIVWIINNMKEVSEGQYHPSLSFTLSRYPMKALANFRRIEDIFSLSIVFFPLKTKNKEMFPKVIPRVHLALRDNSRKAGPFDLVRSGTCHFNSILPSMPFIFSKSIILDSTFVMDDKLTVEIHVESPDCANQVASRNGTMRIAADKYHQRKELEKKKLVLCYMSEYFYTAERGYRVQAAVYFNGADTNKNRGLSVEILFLTGEFDKGLSMEFPHTTTIRLLHPFDNEMHQTIAARNHIRGRNRSYFVHFYGHDWIEKLLVDDSFAIQVNIEGH